MGPKGRRGGGRAIGQKHVPGKDAGQCNPIRPYARCGNCGDRVIPWRPGHRLCRSCFAWRCIYRNIVDTARLRREAEL